MDTINEEPPQGGLGTPRLRRQQEQRQGVSVGGAPAARTLLDVFAATVARCAQRTAIDAGDRRLTYAQLDVEARAVSASLAALGVGQGDRVAVRVASGTAELYVAILGVLLAGAAYVPIDADDPEERARDLWTRSAACAIVGDGLRVTQLAPAGGSSDALAVDGLIRPSTVDDDAWVIFTSGSTGKPKAVAVTHRAAAAFVDAEARLWSVDPGDRVMAGLSVAFDASCEEIWLAWRNGATLVPAPRELVRSGHELGGWIKSRRISVISTVPTLASMWGAETLAGVRLLILGGEACPESLGWRLAAGRELWNTYGPTEATVVSTAARICPGQPITIGWQLDGWTVAVLDGDEPAALGEPGELVIGGVGLGRYLDSDLDEQRFAPVPALGWDRAYRTGDIVRETIDGLAFVGRRDDQVKIGGRRIELGEVEAVLAQAPGVQAAAVAVQESASGNKLLVGYVVGVADPADVRAFAARRLPAGIVPIVVSVPALPLSGAGKLDRKALPWPLDTGTATGAGEASFTVLEAWVAERFSEQLGPVPIAPDSDFFQIGGTSIAAAKLVSVARDRYPALAVADVYHHPTVRAFSARLESIGTGDQTVAEAPIHGRSRWGLVQLVGVFAILLVSAPSWVAGILALDDWAHVGPQLWWPWIVAGWLTLSSPAAKSMLVLAARRLLLRDLRPGRYPRAGWFACRVLFVERLAEVCRLARVAGTPWAARYARLSGQEIGEGAQLGTLPPITSLVQVGPGASIEPDVDLHGWWIVGHELVIGRVSIGADARVGMRSVLMPGARVGDGAEVEPGSLIEVSVPAGEKWAGSPAVRVGRAGEDWHSGPAAVVRRARFWRAMYAVGMTFDTLLPLLASVPEIVLFWLLLGSNRSVAGTNRVLIEFAPVFVALFTLSYALVAAAAIRLLGRLLTPGWHSQHGCVRWALWMTEQVMLGTNAIIFPIYASSFTRRFLRLCGIKLGELTEVSVPVGLNRLTSFGDRSFAADGVAFSSWRLRGGWLHVAPIAVGSRTFLGNHSILTAGTRVGNDSLIGATTVAPAASPDGTSWLGTPPIELPRRPKRADAAHTTHPSWKLRLARRCMDVLRIVLPGSIAVLLGTLVYDALEGVGARFGIVTMLASVPIVLAAGGIAAAIATIAIKWILMGRYRASEHLFYSWYVWLDEMVNSCQEQLAGPWLLGRALGTPVMPIYLRLMGSTVGRDVWVDTLSTTEFDLATFADGCAVSRGAVVDTHLIHDRVMSTGPARVGAGATLGPFSLTLPDTEIGDGCVVSALSLVMRGEQLPPGTRWHGAPVIAD
jgi:non-ribosomal peptide synthetase-like protein